MFNQYMDKVAENTVESLRRNGFEAEYFPDREKLVDFIVKEIKDGDEIGFGGSETLNSLDIKKRIEEMNCSILDTSDPLLDEGERNEIRRRHLLCDVFLTGTNAVTGDGYIVNVDGYGNRVGAMAYGPRKIMIVAGINKITPDLDTAYKRLEFLACPMNARRVADIKGYDNPCQKTGKCVDCRSEDRICRIYTVMKRKPSLSNIKVLLVNENLGF